MGKRNILFKGKRTDNGEWVEGDLICLDDYTLIAGKDMSASNFNSHDKMLEIEVVEVFPESVGQFIGVKGYTGDYEKRHKNEIMLFEGDIVEAWSQGSKGTFVIKYRAESAPIWLLYPNWQSEKHWNIHGSDLGRQKGDYFDALKVVGNIYDNPELLNHEN